MSRLARVISASALLALVVGFAIPALGQEAEDAGAVVVRAVELRDFPLVRLTVSTETQSVLGVEDVTVTENGVPVHVTAVDALGGSGAQVDAVLAIDVSNSMVGTELQTALAAARAFVQGVPASVPVGLVAFAERPRILTQVTADRAVVESELAELAATTTQGTALYEAVVSGAALFDDQVGVQHNLIVLTDGKNTELTADLEDAVRVANAAGVNVFTFALEGSDADLAILGVLSERTGGRFRAITTADLEAVYTNLAAELSRQFVVTYRSKAPLGVPVEVTVGVPSGSGGTRFLTPSVSAVTGEAAEGGLGDPSEAAVTTNAALAVIAGLVFLAVLNLIILLLDAVERRRRRVALQSRMVTDPFAPGAPVGAGSASNPILPRSVSDAAERAAGEGRSAALARKLHQAGWSLRVGEFLPIVAVSGVVAGIGGYLLFGPAGALLAIPAAVAPFAAVSNAATKRLGKIQAQLGDTLMIIASSLRAGHSFLQALDTVTKEIDEPGAGEFGRTMREIRLGRDVDDALDALVERVGSRDLEWAVTAIKIQRKIGGNLAEVLESVAKTIRDRETLRRQVRVLSAEGRISVLVLTVLPVLIAVYLMRVNPAYLRVLTSTRVGLTLIVSAAVLMLIGYVWMQKIVKLDDV